MEVTKVVEVEKEVEVVVTATPEPPSLDMVHVPAGEFTMGSDEGDSDEQPVHTVYLDAFYIDKTEVTNAQFAAFVSATGYETDAEQKGCGWSYEGARCIQGVDWQHPFGPDTDLAAKDEHPVVHVSWNDAKAYCEWAGARLPTEAEWEKAARGTDGLTYPWGNDFDCHKGNFDDEQEIDDYVVSGGPNCDGYVRTAPVGSYPDGASLYGALDMAGNVWEWVADWYDRGYYASSPESNPRGPASGDYGHRVIRGGSCPNAADMRAANRCSTAPVGTYDLVGFRCAR